MQANTPTAPSARSAAKITTHELADMLRVEQQTVRASYCRNGHYLGLRPLKLSNGKLLWDLTSAERLIAGGANV